MNTIKHLLWMSRKVYHERGLWSLIERIFTYCEDLVSILSYLSGGDVLYVSGCPGGSRLYRCTNQAEILHQYGITSRILSQGIPGLLSLVPLYDIFIFQRVIYDEYIGEVIAEIKKQGKTILFETDDLVFDPAHLPLMHYYHSMGDEEKKWYENGIGREILENPYVTHCIVATDFLADMLNKKYPGKSVFVSKNKLSEQQISSANDVFSRKSSYKPQDGKIRIGYFSGSRSHDRDFAAIADVLLRMLGSDPNVVLMIVGPLHLPYMFDALQSQIERYPFVTLKNLRKLIARADINIAPLEIDNLFCQGKSALKFFEAGLFEIPTIASATDSFQRVITHDVNGFLATTPEEWERYLLLLISDAALRERIGKQARKDTLTYWTISKDDESGALAAFIRARLKRGEEIRTDTHLMFRDFYRTRVKRFIPKRIFLFYNTLKELFGVPFPESALAHRYLDGLKGLEIGGSVHNPFGFDTKNVDYTADENRYKKLEKKFIGEALPVDIVAPGDNIPLPDESQDFVVSAHVIEHFPDPIKALKEWYRLIRPGGYIFMIVPNKEKTFDQDRPRTTLQELIDRHAGRIMAQPNPDDHYSVWMMDDMIELVRYLGWTVIDTQAVDDKVGNGFTIVIRK